MSDTKGAEGPKWPESDWGRSVLDGRPRGRRRPEGRPAKRREGYRPRSAARSGACTSSSDDLAAAEVEAQSYSRDRSIAGVLSLLGLGRVIVRRGLEDVLAGRTTPDDFAPSVWDERNAKLARAEADDALVADEAVLEAAKAYDGTRVTFPMGPLALEFDRSPPCGSTNTRSAPGTRRSSSMTAPIATLDAADVVEDNLGLIARFSVWPTGEVRTTGIGTSDPAPDFTVRLSADSVELAAVEERRTHDLVLVAEPFCRLVYGRPATRRARARIS
jgi:hypothetical protein